MKVSRRRVAFSILCVSLLAGCGNDNPTAPPDSGNGPITDLGPFNAFDIFLRPYVVQRPSLADGLPTPILTEHYLAAFYRGGTELATFDWVVPATVGTVEPKLPSLSRTDATVTLRLRQDGDLPLGSFDIEAHGHSGEATGNLRRRFYVVRNTWMKHQRAYFRGDPPAALISRPVFVSRPGAAADADTILYVENTSSTTVRLRRIPAFASLNGLEPTPGDTHTNPLVPDPNNYESAAKTEPDVSPSALGRREMLFSSDMDPQYPDRCPGLTCINTSPFRLWVARLPDHDTQFTARALTQDSSVVRSGSTNWYAFEYRMPRWDPAATNPAARIAFLTDLAGDSKLNLWLADLVDVNGDTYSDTLTNYRQLTHAGGIGSYDWHPDGTRICVADLTGLAWIDPVTGASTPIVLPDSSLTRMQTPAVYWQPGQHTLIAFQAEAENLSNLYVLDEEDHLLSRLLPFSMPVTTTLFPRWHPTRKKIVYVSDYTVEAWANSVEGHPGNDRLNPNQPEVFGMRRTFYPSLWVLTLE